MEVLLLVALVALMVVVVATRVARDQRVAVRVPVRMNPPRARRR
jgi:hypothetical protein